MPSVATKDKIGYGEWQHGRGLITDLQRKYGMSLTAISRAVKGDGDSPGWAQAAYDHRSMMTPEQYGKLVKLHAAARGGTMHRLVAIEAYIERLNHPAQDAPVAETAVESPSEPEPTPTPEPVVEKQEKPTERARSDFASQLHRTRLAAKTLVDEMEMLGAVAPTFARRGVEGLLDRMKPIVSDLEG